MTTVVKFPYNACRRVHSRKPRISKNGTPEERAAKAAADTAELTSATVADISSRRDDNQRLAKVVLRVYFMQEFARGRDVDQIFDDLEERYGRLDR
jgi:hypothetical protein